MTLKKTSNFKIFFLITLFVFTTSCSKENSPSDEVSLESSGNKKSKAKKKRAKNRSKKVPPKQIKIASGIRQLKKVDVESLSDEQKKNYRIANRRRFLQIDFKGIKQTNFAWLSQKLNHSVSNINNKEKRQQAQKAKQKINKDFRSKSNKLIEQYRKQFKTENKAFHSKIRQLGEKIKVIVTPYEKNLETLEKSKDTAALEKLQKEIDAKTASLREQRSKLRQAFRGNRKKHVKQLNSSLKNFRISAIKTYKDGLNSGPQNKKESSKKKASSNSPTSDSSAANAKNDQSSLSQASN